MHLNVINVSPSTGCRTLYQDMSQLRKKFIQKRKVKINYFFLTKTSSIYKLSAKHCCIIEWRLQHHQDSPDILYGMSLSPISCKGKSSQKWEFCQVKETWYYGNTLSYSPETFGWLVWLVHTPPNMWLEHLVRVLYCGFFRSVFAISISRRQNESFLLTEILLFCRELCCCFFLIHLTYSTFWFYMSNTDRWKSV